MGKPKAPAPPDYAAATTAQGTANTSSAMATNFLNQANQNNPYGSLTYDYDFENAMTLPDGTRIPRTTVNTTLSPEQQRLLDQNNAMSGQLNDLAIKGIGYVDQASSNPIDQSSLPGLRPNVPESGVNLVDSSAIGRGPMQTGVDPTQFRNQYDFSGVGAMPSSSDFAAQRDQITDAMMQRLQPYIQRDRDSLENRMANQGLGIGTEARDWEQRRLERDVNDQRIAALLAGSGEQQRLFGNAMGIRQQGIGEAMSQGDLYNTAAANRFGQDFSRAGFANDAQNQAFQQALAAAGFQNTAQGQAFQQGLAGGQFANQARQQAIQEADYFKNQPLNMLNALRSGNQVSMPQFGNVMAGSVIAPPPVYQATADRYGAEMDAYRAKMANFSGFLGGLGGIGGAAIGKWG